MHAQLTSDLDTQDTEIERHKSTARRQKINHFQEIDVIEGQHDSLETTMSTPRTLPLCVSHHHLEPLSLHRVAVLADQSCN